MNPLKYAYQPTLLLPKSKKKLLEEQMEIGNDTIANVSRNAHKGLFFRGQGRNPISRLLVSAISDIASLYDSRNSQGCGYNGKWSVRVNRAANSCIREKLCTDRYLDDKELAKLVKKDSPEAFSIDNEWQNYLGKQELAQDAFIISFNSLVCEEVCHSLGYFHAKEKRKDADKMFSYIVDMEKLHGNNTVNSE